MDLPSVIDPVAISLALRQSFTRYDLTEGEQDVAIALRWAGPPSYERLAALADGLIRGSHETLAARKPIYVVADGDIAHSLGNILKEDERVPSEILVIDGVTLRGFDYVDLGRIRMPSRTVPVTVKSLVFSEDPSFHGKSEVAGWHAHDDGAMHRHDHDHGHSHHHHGDHAHSHHHSHDE
jgi:ethanolamine utilization protein EutA